MTDNLRGAGLMALGMTAFAANDTVIKGLGVDLPLGQLVFLRGVGASVLLAILAYALGALKLSLSGRDWRLIVVRSMAEAASAWFMLTALFHMPLANITAILQALPLSVTLAGAVFLREPIGWRRMSAILVGFTGMLLIVRPGPDGFSIYAIYGLLTVVCATIRDITTRKLSRDVPSLTATLFTSIIVALFGLSLIPVEGWVAMSAGQGAQIMVTAVFILVAYLSLVMAMRIGEIGFVAPFRYSGLLAALVLGYLVFGDWPDWITMLGATILVVTGLYTLIRENSLRAG